MPYSMPLPDSQATIQQEVIRLVRLGIAIQDAAGQVPGADSEHAGRVEQADHTVILADADDTELIRTEVGEGAAGEQRFSRGIAAAAGGGAGRTILRQPTQ